MDVWHSDGRREPVPTGCGTAHCIAGWVVTITPGGVEFSRHIEGLFRQRASEVPGLRPEVVGAADGSAESAAALAILYESGWQQYVSADHFFSSDREALILLHQLAGTEEQLERGSVPVLVPVNRAAPTVIP